ncbi:MAG: type II secretion system protein [Gemmatimonadaceae bacterium]
MRSRGFTLVELLITVAIIATLASIAMPLSEISAQREKEHELRRALRVVRDALDAYKHAADEGRIVRAADQSGFPPSLGVLVEGVPDAKSSAGAKIYFLRRLPRDPMYPDDTASPSQTWRLRSYDSPPDKPVPGKDVFDISSSSDKIGLNGVPYREW